MFYCSDYNDILILETPTKLGMPMPFWLVLKPSLLPSLVPSDDLCT